MPARTGFVSSQIPHALCGAILLSNAWGMPGKGEGGGGNGRTWNRLVHNELGLLLSYLQLLDLGNDFNLVSFQLL